MSKTTKWIIGIVAVLVILQFVMPFVWHLIYPTSYGMMRGGGFGYGSRMPMMGGTPFGFGMHSMLGLGGFFMWLFPLGLLALIGLGIVYLWRKINEKPAQQ